MYRLSRATFALLAGFIAGLILLFATGALRTPGAEARASVAPAVAPTLQSAQLAPSWHRSTRAGTSKHDNGSLAEVKSRAPTADKKPKKDPLPTDPCERNVQIAASKGLTLPKGWEMHCVGPGLDWDGNTHWGVTCRYSQCPEGKGPYVSISNPTYYVIAHELCHANYGDDELMADHCAQQHGASLATSPYPH